jgi:VanZ like family/Concanavalin A-like lectin/glucanases superfamily
LPTEPVTSWIRDRRVFRALAIGLALGISAACLWPFQAPKNEVSWLPDHDGLQFGGFGTVISAQPFRLPEADDNRGWSLELWVQPSRPTARGRLLSFYSPISTNRLSLRQDREAIVVSTDDKHEDRNPTQASLYCDGVFLAADPVLLSITATGQRTSVFVDGRLRRSSEIPTFSRRALDGQIILGDSPWRSESWPGQIRGLAVYGSELSPAEVSRHFNDWGADKAPALREEEFPAAMYRFNEHAGSIVRSQIQSVDLTIPERYMVAGKAFLAGPLEEYYPVWSYSESIAVNILGFVPFGYAWCGYLSLSFPRRTSVMALTTVILGAMLSLTVEVVQGFLPTRSSGVADIITNTLGTILGVAAYRLTEESIHRILSRSWVAPAR